MPELDLQVEGFEVARHAAAPTLLFKLRMSNAIAGQQVANVALQCQIQIEARRRRYDAGEQQRLDELFGEPARWGETLRTLFWTQTQVMVPAFQDSCVVDLPVACSFDFNVAINKYFAGLESGEVPLAFQFSGTVFYRDEDGALQVGRIAWDREARLALPVSAWREMIERYYPNSVWLSLPRDLFDRLNGWRLAHGLLTWEQGLESLLDRSDRTEQEAV